MSTALRFPTPLSVAIAVLGCATESCMSGRVGRYSAHRQTLYLTDLRTQATAVLVIARAATAASSFELMLGHVTTKTMRRHVLRVLRAFVRETPAPLITVLATQAA